MSVKRYQLLDDAIDAATMDEVPHGEYVKHSDYAALEAENQEMLTALVAVVVFFEDTFAHPGRFSEYRMAHDLVVRIGRKALASNRKAQP